MTSLLALPLGPIAPDHTLAPRDTAPSPHATIPLRLALVTDDWPPRRGAITRQLTSFVREAERRGFAVRVYSGPGSRQRSLAADWRAWRPDVVHVAARGYRGWVASRIARRLAIPVVTSWPEDPQANGRNRPWTLARHWVWRTAMHAHADRVWCASISARRTLRAQGIGQADVWKRGVNAQAFSPGWRSTVFRQSIGVTGQDLLVLLTPRPGRSIDLATVFGAMRDPAMLSAPHSVTLLVVGDDAPPTLRSRAPSRVVFTGRLSGHALSGAFASCDICVAPVVDHALLPLEAMASGLPVIAGESPDAGALLAHGGGVMVRPDDPEDLAVALRAIADDPSWRVQLADAARRSAERRTWDAVWDAICGDYIATAASAVCRSRTTTVPSGRDGGVPPFHPRGDPLRPLNA